VKYAVEMGSSTMTHIQSLVKIGSGIQKLIGGYTGTQIHRQHGDHISPLSFLQNEESRIEMRNRIAA
jgi:hypothetical protein